VVGGGVGAAAAGAFAMGARERSARLRQKPFVVSISEETSASIPIKKPKKGKKH